MEPSMVEAHLKQAERHAARGEEIIADQKRPISELERDRHDTKSSRELRLRNSKGSILRTVTGFGRS
ncbi:MAG: hypothetical protein ACR652_14175 [Methylocystis sp.]|uniref:hypothetical protein n=1 Tax=Methylocystis sp. TaxID=1911079 RepID=UPI003DA2C6F3